MATDEPLDPRWEYEPDEIRKAIAELQIAAAHLEERITALDAKLDAVLKAADAAD